MKNRKPKIVDVSRKMRGDFEMFVYEDGKLIKYIFEENLIVDAGRGAVANLIGGTGTPVTKISFGTGSVAPAAGDTALTAPYTKNIATAVPGTGVTHPTALQTKYSWTLETAENNGVSITEFGLLCTDNTLFARKVRSAIPKTSAIRIVGTWTINL